MHQDIRGIRKHTEMAKNIIYQMLPRLWGNSNCSKTKGGRLEENGTGKFSDITAADLDYIRWLGCSHVWYTGIIRHSTKADTGGCIPSNHQFVKGEAGSPYAICDYYDVNPYLADNPDRRMEEFNDLVERTHRAGLKVIIDFVPNHVSRDYGRLNSFVRENDLGSSDDRTVHWSENNDFFYYPGQQLTLPVPPAQGEEPYHECPAMVTGNNCFSTAPGINDWYETIKINYGETYSPTWERMYSIVRFWASKGIDGFRCDMVELVPAEFFRWLISRIREEFPGIIFIAEVYKKDLYRKYIREVGFDMLYDKSGLYDTLRAIVEKNTGSSALPGELWQSATGITRNWQFLGDMQPYMLNFLENHDEQRFASDFFGKSPANTYAPLYVSLMMNTSSFMVYFGEEVGERGMKEEGFSGKDGRTTIFDWWSIDSVRRLRKAIASGAYRDLSEDSLVRAGLLPEEASVFCRFASALRLAASEPAISKGTMYDLCYCNYASDGFDKNRHYAFLRDYNESTLLVVANFSSADASMKLYIPQHAFEWLELEETPSLNHMTPIDVSVKAMDATIVRLSR